MKGHGRNVDFLTTDDFNNGAGRLNLETFKNIEKAVTVAELQAMKSTHNIYTESSLIAYFRDLKNSLQKGGESDIAEVAKSSLNGMQTLSVLMGNGTEKKVYAQPKTAVKSQDLQKSHITEAFAWTDKISFNKKGSEIIQKMQTICDEEKSKQNELNSKMVVLLTQIDEEPTEDASEYCYRGFYGVIPKLKMYAWEKCCKPYKSEIGSLTMGSTRQPDMPATPEEEKKAKMREYNKCAEELLDSKAECALLDTYMKNLSPLKDYELTPKQITVLKF